MGSKETEPTISHLALAGRPLKLSVDWGHDLDVFSRSILDIWSGTPKNWTWSFLGSILNWYAFTRCSGKRRLDWPRGFIHLFVSLVAFLSCSYLHGWSGVGWREAITSLAFSVLQMLRWSAHAYLDRTTILNISLLVEVSCIFYVFLAKIYNYHACQNMRGKAAGCDGGIILWYSIYIYITISYVNWLYYISTNYTMCQLTIS